MFGSAAATANEGVLLRGLTLPAFPRTAGGLPQPTVLQRLDQEFLPAVLEELQSAEGHRKLAASLAKATDARGRRRLFQPVHRTFHLVLLEAVCDRFGEPRLDPKSIDSAGLVIRRLPVAGESGGPQGWMQAGTSLRGWVPLGAGAEQDPDPARRPARLKAGHPEIDRRLRLLGAAGEPPAETVSPLFVASPAVCAAAGRTVLYGLVPVASSEKSEAPTPSPQLERAKVEAHLSLLLKNDQARTGYDWLGKTVTAETFETLTHAPTLKTCLEQLLIELDAFGTSTGGRALFALLESINLNLPGGGTRKAGQLLKDAADALINRSRASVTLPTVWPALSADLRRRLLDATQKQMEARLVPLTPGEGRFDRFGRLYQLRAFARVRHGETGGAGGKKHVCPPDLVWSPPSDAFAITPWYENGNAPPVLISLPDPTDRGFLEKVKPDVAFAVPEGLFQQLQGTSLDGLMKGKKGGGGGGIGLGWICGFNIPIITLCAFFVLNIFLSLFNILFFWLPLVKICIPFPKKE